MMTKHMTCIYKALDDILESAISNIFDILSTIYPSGI